MDEETFKGFVAFMVILMLIFWMLIALVSADKNPADKDDMKLNRLGGIYDKCGRCSGAGDGVDYYSHAHCAWNEGMNGREVSQLCRG